MLIPYPGQFIIHLVSYMLLLYFGYSNKRGNLTEREQTDISNKLQVIYVQKPNNVHSSHYI